MSESPSISHTTLEIDESSQPPVIITTTMQQLQRPLKHKINFHSAPNFSAFLRSPSGHGGGFLHNLIQRTTAHRQKADIQLQSLLNEPEESLPTFIRRASDHLGSEQLSIEQVSKLLHTQPFIIERLVRILYSSIDNDKDITTLSKSEVQKLTRILTSTIDVRALIFFMILAEKGNDYVTNNGLRQFYEKYLKHLKTFDENRLQEVIQVLLHKFHLDQKSQIDFEEFYSIVSKDSTLLESLSQFTVHPAWFIESSSIPSIKQNKFRRFFSNYYSQQKIYEQQTNKLTIDYIKDNLSRIILLILYLLINLALIIYVIIYRTIKIKSHVLVIFARIGGILLNFNCALIVILMLKHAILLIRTNKLLRKLIPVDDHIDFHKVIGRIIAVLAILHTIAHIANFGRLDDYSWATYMFTTKPDIGWIGGFAPLSGVILCVILIVIIICSMQWIRRGGYFQIFYWTHLLYLPFFVFLIIHAENFWKWIIGPLSLFLLEKIYSILTRYSSRSGRTYLHSVTIEQSNVISLTIHRPKNFSFKPGDYMSINLPRVALHEFHPFTISSAPEETDYLRIHIQAVGNWTKQVYQRFKEMSEDIVQENQIKIYRADIHPEESAADLKNIEQNHIHDIDNDDDNDDDDDGNVSGITKSQVKLRKREPVFIKGPYSSCARYVFDCKHVVLIGGGIGITPYASILSSLMAQCRASYVVCKHCDSINYSSKGLTGNRRLKKVDFIWVNRDYKNFEWFLNLLRQFEQEQEYYLASNSNEKRFLDIRLYFTEIKHDQNIGNVPLDLVTKIWAEIAGQDIFTNLKSKTHIGRPQWKNIFNELISGENASTANDVSVFFCGPSTMAKAIQNHCATFRFRFYEEKF
ncbi:unnamed protein product [Rotaria sordida]|uniref:FAD-binding FR-type domain-containing protein n=1 Tax=Rotaria sordida TaxID=392033 RepID=A0A815LV54_9BILA|nr:unnamed protein product [Rotaria sordida]CAF1409149.1 unnamed protein product [Rotaria sordida]